MKLQKKIMPADIASEKKSLLTYARNWYARFERPFSSISLIGGFVFDAVTLTRVDEFWENSWVLGHLLIVTICALIINLVENEAENEKNPAKLHFWLVNIMQFFFGGIFSTYLVFYFRSGTITTSWPFLVVLSAAFIANERLKHHYARFAFQISLLFLSYYLFAIYLLPILFHQISTPVFLLSGVVSLLAIGGLIYILRRFARERFKGKSIWIVRACIVAITIGVNLLYFYNLIPPLPLSLKSAEIYQSLTVNGPGQYTVLHEDQGWFRFFNWNETIHIVPGDPLYAYTAVFSPTALNTNIVHEWQFYNPAANNGSGSWVTRGRIPLALTGGADGGYRTFSLVPNITAGAWRVNVKTPGGQVIGQLRFNVITASSEPALATQEIN